MRHKYETRGIVLSRAPLGEASTQVFITTPELGAVQARVQGLRKPGAKLAAALVTFAESELTLVRGKDGWRVAGAVLKEQWFVRLGSASARARAARVVGLFLRLSAPDTEDGGPFAVVRGFLAALSGLPAEAHDDVETLAALRILSLLGLDAGPIPGALDDYAEAARAEARTKRREFVARINRGIEASGL